MTNDQAMQARRYLEDYRLLIRRREALLAERDSLRSATGRAGRNPEAPVPGEDAINDVIEHIGEAITVRLVLMERMPNEQQKLVLTLRYLNGWSWDDICRQMNYRRGQIFRFHRDALTAFSDLMSKSR